MFGSILQIEQNIDTSIVQQIVNNGLFDYGYNFSLFINHKL